MYIVRGVAILLYRWYIYFMKFWITLFFSTLSFFSFGQNESFLVFPEVDSLYREDQIYIGSTFHIINNRPSGISQSGFSGGVHAGIIRDMPFTKKRNWAVGVGLGYSINTYNQDLLIAPDDVLGVSFKEIEDADNLDRNWFTTHIIEVPLEIRWRTSTPESYKFWRVYGGVRLGYMNYFKSKFTSDDGVEIINKDPNGLERFRMGATLTFGWNTFNFHVYYSLNDLFDDSVEVIDQNGALQIIKVGLMFYIL